MDLLVGCAGRHHFPEEAHEVQTRVPGRRLPLNLARLHVQRRVERQCAVPLVLESVALDPARRERQHPVPPVERLDGGLLVDAEHGGMAGRVQVETDDVGGLRLEVGVVRRHIAGQPVWPHVRLAPNPLYDVLVHAEVGREAAARPVGRPVGRRAACGGQQAGAQPHRQLPPRPAPVTVRQALHAVLQEPPTPLGDGRTRDVEPRLHRPCGNALGEEQHDLGALDESRGQGVRAGDLLEVIALYVGQMNRLSFKGHIRRRRQPNGKPLSSTAH